MYSSDSSSEEELVVVTLALSAEEKERTPTFHKRLWVHEMNKKRATEGEFQKLQVDPENLDIIVLATTWWHNFLRGDDENLWQPGELERQETLAGMHGLPRVGGNATAEAFHIRESFKNYFISPEGKVVWQDEMVNRGRRNNLTQENNVN